MACKFHSVISLTGVIMGFLVTSASPYDNQVLVDLLGDGAFNDAALQSFLEQYRGLQLLAPTKVNQASKRSPQAQRQRGHLRLICERSMRNGHEQLHLSKYYAQSAPGD